MAEKDQVLKHNYDGIQEYDNDLPRWWLAIFWICAAFAVAYAGYLHLGPGKDQYAQIALDMKDWQKLRSSKEAEEKAKQPRTVDVNTLLTDPAHISGGGKIYKEKCAVCHGAEAQGLVGPNLTDEFWIHGNSYEKVKHTIINGVPAKGMIPWKGTLTNNEIDSVIAFMHSIQGSNPVNPKAPQGDKTGFLSSSETNS